jgi:hypothetical protein
VTFLVEYWPGGKAKGTRWQKAGAFSSMADAETKVADLRFRLSPNPKHYRITEVPA